MDLHVFKVFFDVHDVSQQVEFLLVFSQGYIVKKSNNPESIGKVGRQDFVYAFSALVATDNDHVTEVIALSPHILEDLQKNDAEESDCT
jgi:hypothetical protein